LKPVDHKDVDETFHRIRSPTLRLRALKRAERQALPSGDAAPARIERSAPGNVHYLATRKHSQVNHVLLTRAALLSPHKERLSVLKD
jgi:hypothetical protein